MKRILIGSMLVLTLLLLMPSIPAIQQKSIEEEYKQDLQEKLDISNLDDLKDIKDLDWKRHPILYLFVIFIIYFGFLRADILMDISTYNDWAGPAVEHWLIYLRSCWVEFSTIAWLFFWMGVSESLGWNWNLGEPWLP